MGIAEAGNGLAPVLAVAVSAALLVGNLLAIRDQTRTKRAADNFRIQNLEPVGNGHPSSLYLVVCFCSCGAGALARCRCLCCCCCFSWAVTIVSPGAALAATLFADEGVHATRNLAAQNTRRVTLVGRTSPSAV